MAAPAIVHASLPLIECNLVDSHREIIGNSDLVARSFVVPSINLVRWATHHEFAGGHHDHFRAIFALSEYVTDGVG
jgi:hypothetical protein